MEERLEQERLKKLEQLREKGIDPHGRKIENVQPVESVLADFAEEKTARVAGRMTALRNFGKAAFADLRDSTGRLQIYFKKDHIGDEGFELFQLIDLGDLIAVEGKLGKTRTGEPTLFVEKLWLLSKSLLPMPEKWHGLTDVEVRYRQRYVDLISNPEVMQTFKRRVKIISEIRRFLDARGFLEVETPMMQSIPGGAAARPFITHHNTLDMDLYLRISPELFLKRLLVGGMERVYEINRNFRNEGLSTRHNPEFTMMEIYQAYADYNDMMDLTEELITSLVQSVHGGTEIEFNGVKLNFARPWARKRWNDLLKEHAGVGIEDEAALRSRAADLSLNPEGDPAVVANRIFEECVEGKLVQPTFVLDYPKALCPLTKQCPDDPRFAARFEMYICSMECANAYTELNDPLDQEKRFREQLEEEAGQVRTVDEDFVRALKYGMPPAGGLGIGIDRIVMVLTNSPSIRDVILFPVMRTAAE